MVFSDMVTGNNVSLSTIDTGGAGDVLLLVHGIMMSKEVWYQQIDYFAGEFRVIAVDLYGFGASRGKFRDSAYQDHADDLNALLDQLNVDSAHVLGWSMGGAIAMVFARQYPGRVKSMVLVGTTPVLVATDDFPYAMDPENAAHMVETLTTASAQGITDFVALMFPETNCAEAVERITDIAGRADLTVTLTHFAASGRTDLRGILSGINAPTLIVHGDLDAICSTRAGQYMAEKIQNGQYRPIKGAGHAPFLTRAGEFNLQVHNFLKSQSKE